MDDKEFFDKLIQMYDECSSLLPKEFVTPTYEKLPELDLDSYILTEEYYKNIREKIASAERNKNI